MARIPLVLIPGVLCTEALWAAQTEALADLAEIAVTRQHLAHGNLGDLARAILDEAPARFAVAGLSFGGYICFELLRQAPERIDRVALLDTSARADTPERRAQRLRDLKQVGRGRFLGVTDRLLRLFLHPDHAADATLAMRVKAMAQSVGAAAFVRQQHAVMSRPDSRADLAAIRCPALVLCGADDQLTPPHLAREIHAGIAGARLAIVPRCGHLSTMEQPAAVNAAMRDWLASQPS